MKTMIKTLAIGLAIITMFSTMLLGGAYALSSAPVDAKTVSGGDFVDSSLFVKLNENNLNILMELFSSTISEYADADIIETKSVYGKLNGNGNGIQYFGSVLIRKDSIKNVVSLVEKLDLQFEIVEYCVQDECDISSKYLEHKMLKYDSPINADSEYISIIFFNSKHPDSDFLDEAGH